MWLMVGCGVGLKGYGDGTSSAIGTDPPPPTEVTIEGLLYGIGADDFVVAEPAGLEAFVEELLEYDLLVYVGEELPESLHLYIALSGADGYQNPCEDVWALPKADWEDPVFRVGPADMTTRMGGADATIRDLEMAGTFDPYAVDWHDGSMVGTLDGRELGAALPEELQACDVLADLGTPCVACDDGSASCFTVRLEDIRATQVTWPFDPSPDGAGCP